MNEGNSVKTDIFNFNNIIRKPSFSFNYSKIRPTNFNRLFNLRDSDRDGIADVFDCRSNNKKYQDVRPNILMMQKLEKLPIYVQSKKDVSKVYHISSKKIPKEERNRVFSLFKSYPTLPTRIKKSKRTTVFTTAKEEGEKPSAGKHKYGFYTEGPEYIQITPEKKVRKMAVIRMTDEPYAKKPETKYNRVSRLEAAKTLVHEQKHIEQYKKTEKRPSLREKLFAGRYSRQKGEIEARDAEQKYEYNIGKDKEIPSSTVTKTVEKYPQRYYPSEEKAKAV